LECSEGVIEELGQDLRVDRAQEDVWGAKIRCALREISDLQAGRYFWHPTPRNPHRRSLNRRLTWFVPAFSVRERLWKGREWCQGCSWVDRRPAHAAGRWTASAAAWRNRSRDSCVKTNVVKN
jgi:hypothetical protein